VEAERSGIGRDRTRQELAGRLSSGAFLDEKYVAVFAAIAFLSIIVKARPDLPGAANGALLWNGRSACHADTDVIAK
jgi:hypothetical protein